MEDVEQIHIDVAEVCIFCAASLNRATSELNGQHDRGGPEWCTAKPRCSYAIADIQRAAEEMGGPAILERLCGSDTRGSANSDIIQHALSLDLNPKLRAAIERLAAEVML